MEITEEMSAKAERLNAKAKELKQALCANRAQIKELYEQFLKENGLDGCVRHKSDENGITRYRLYACEYEDGVEFRAFNERDRMLLGASGVVNGCTYPACCRPESAVNPLAAMQEILENYVPCE